MPAEEARVVVDLLQDVFSAVAASPDRTLVPTTDLLDISEIPQWLHRKADCKMKGASDAIQL